MALAAAPAIATALAPYALQAINHALPTLGKVIGNDIFALGKPSVKAFLEATLEKAKSPEGREHILKALNGGVHTGSKILNEGLDLAKVLGVKHRNVEHVRGILDTKKKNIQDVIGRISKINHRFRF